MPGGRPRLAVTEKAARTTITLTPDTHDHAVLAGLNISAICKSALRQRLNRHILLPDVQKTLTDELHVLEAELNPVLNEKQHLKFANLRKTINRLEGAAYIVMDKTKSNG